MERFPDHELSAKLKPKSGWATSTARLQKRWTRSLAIIPAERCRIACRRWRLSGTRSRPLSPMLRRLWSNSTRMRRTRTAKRCVTSKRPLPPQTKIAVQQPMRLFGRLSRKSSFIYEDHTSPWRSKYTASSPPCSGFLRGPRPIPRVWGCTGCGRVEMWRGGFRFEHICSRLFRLAVPHWFDHGSVSTSRSSNRTCSSPASGSRTRSHAFVHGTSCPSLFKRTSPKCPYRCESG
jgi:hypothetical protein